MGLILLIIVILLLIGAFPTRGYGFGYGSHGILGTILIIILILWLLGRLKFRGQQGHASIFEHSQSRATSYQSLSLLRPAGESCGTAQRVASIRLSSLARHRGQRCGHSGPGLQNA